MLSFWVFCKFFLSDQNNIQIQRSWHILNLHIYCHFLRDPSLAALPYFVPSHSLFQTLLPENSQTRTRYLRSGSWETDSCSLLWHDDPMERIQHRLFLYLSRAIFLKAASSIYRKFSRHIETMSFCVCMGANGVILWRLTGREDSIHMWRNWHSSLLIRGNALNCSLVQNYTQQYNNKIKIFCFNLQETVNCYIRSMLSMVNIINVQKCSGVYILKEKK